MYCSFCTREMDQSFEKIKCSCGAAGSLKKAENEQILTLARECENVTTTWCPFCGEELTMRAFVTMSGDKTKEKRSSLKCKCGCEIDIKTKGRDATICATKLNTEKL